MAAVLDVTCDRPDLLQLTGDSIAIKCHRVEKLEICFSSFRYKFHEPMCVLRGLIPEKFVNDRVNLTIARVQFQNYEKKNNYFNEDTVSDQDYSSLLWR